MKRWKYGILSGMLTAAFLLQGCGSAPTGDKAGQSAGDRKENVQEVSKAAGKGEEDAGQQKNGERPASSGKEEGPVISSAEGQTMEGAVYVQEESEYTSKEEVAAYIYEFGHLPSNYITKKEAKDLGWVSSEGNLWEVAPGKSIGGDHYGNYEGLLPEEEGQSYRECDIDFDGTYRNAKRIIYSDQRQIYYTEDHYQSFEKLYG